VRLPIMIAQMEPVAIDHARPAASTTAPAPAPVRLDGIHVLAVDDDQDALVMLREILEGAGAAVTTAGSAQGALEALPGCRPDVLLTDLGMPGMDGFELIARVRQAVNAPFGNVPAAALTAYARSEDRTRALRSGFQMHLAKPIDPAELVAAVSVLAHQ
jgi:CheY-like chemotaxis protein